jgi:hypothetical protein
MPIVSSIIDQDSAQRDGRRAIRELHTDHVGVQYPVQYLAPAVFDANAALAARVSVLEDQIKQAEISANIAQVMAVGSLASPTLVYSTAAENFAALRTAYQTSTQVQAVMIGDFLNTLSNAQLQAAFGLTAGQVTTLRTNKLTPAASLAASIRATVGQ